ncbi:MAG TPA: PEP-CTERM-box response regulator transcription factor [Stellaceae bacterium]|nr:PEP-CTERM-box response regulator transcription factor [Stellaceae bacterium]
MPNEKPKLLIVEDDAGLRRQLAWTFDDYEVSLAGDREAALALVKSEEPPVVTLDLGLPPDPDGASEGLATLERIQQESPYTKVIIITGNGERQNALRAITLGAYDFYQKPIEPETIRLIVARALNLHELESENRRLQAVQQHSPLEGVVTVSPSMLAVCRMVERVSPSSANVLILGESGTGKELIARALHRMSARAAKRLVAVNCAAIPENLLESELFGHEKGAFTGAHKQVIGKFEMANGGTFFLDEIGDMPLTLQSKLLRFIQERKIERVGGRVEIPIDVRIVCATHQPLEDLIKAQRFRDDLYYRLNEISINLPPLRHRPGDAVLLANYFLMAAAGRNRKDRRRFAPDAIGALERHAWPGNVRELENRVKRAVIMADGAYITAADLELTAPCAPVSLKEARERAEVEVVLSALSQTQGNISQAALILDVSRPTLQQFVRHHGIRPAEHAPRTDPAV